MPNIASVLKSEIARIARKETRAEVEALKKVSSQYRSDIATLKRRLSVLEKLVKKSSSTPRVGRATDDQSAKPVEGLRFRAAGFAAHRQRLGLSAEQFGKLIGVTGQSIYKWETGKTRPRASQMAAIAKARGLGKKEAIALLSE